MATRNDPRLGGLRIDEQVVSTSLTEAADAHEGSLNWAENQGRHPGKEVLGVVV